MERTHAGCLFSDGGGRPVPVESFKGAPPILVDGAASFLDCSFRRCGGVFLGAKSKQRHIIEARDSSTAVRVERCLFADNPIDHVLLRVNSSSSVFADDEALTMWDSATRRVVGTEPLSSVPARPLFLHSNDAWFQDVQRVRSPSSVIRVV